MNFYNEIDRAAAAWLRELIAAGHIANGVVDERSIEDINPDELRQYTQCHFFAGIGVWSYVLRQAGWPDDRPVWTGSCPCQPFSTAGKRKGTTDERHLWPSWFHLISECKPETVFGEQVDAAIRQGWLDLVQADMEGIGYAFGAAVIPACGVGAPHIRQRLWFVANAPSLRFHQRWTSASASVQGQCSERSGQHAQSGKDGQLSRGFEGLCRSCGLVESGALGRQRWEGAATRRISSGPNAGRKQSDNGTPSTCKIGVTQGDTIGAGLERHTGDGHSNGERADTARPTAALGDVDTLAYIECNEEHGKQQGPTAPEGRRKADESSGRGLCNPGRVSGPTNGAWGNADWLFCRDGKWRPVEPGTFPLAHGSPARVGRLRGYGNAIVAPVAQAFISAAMELI